MHNTLWESFTSFNFPGSESPENNFNNGQVSGFTIEVTRNSLYLNCLFLFLMNLWLIFVKREKGLIIRRKHKNLKCVQKNPFILSFKLCLTDCLFQL